MFIFTGILLMGIVGFFLHLFLSKEPKTPLRVARLFLLYQIVFSIGFASLLAFYGLTFMPQFVADYSGWPRCQFQELLGNVNLAFATLAFLCLWKGDEFWLATIIGVSIWLLGDAITHIIDMKRNNNYAPGNVGVPLWTDIIIPIVLLIAYAVYAYLKKKDQKQSTDL